jgi:hypothetical protein
MAAAAALPATGRHRCLNDPGDLVAAEFNHLIPVSALPSTLVMAPDGKIAGRVIGATSVQDLRRLIKAAALPRPSAPLASAG